MEPITASLAQGAIALLIDLAQRGEIDPWNVQVIEVIDRCLSELTAVDDLQPGFYESNLSQSGQAFLDASLLVLLKANTLERLQQPETDTENPEADLEDPEDWSDPRLPLNLERQLRRRPSAQPPQNRRVTLQELIEQLQLVAAAIEKQGTRSRRPSSRANTKASTQAMRAALELAQQENLSEMARALEQLLMQHWPSLSQEQDWLDLEHLLGLWSEAMTTKTPDLDSSSDRALRAESNHDRVGIFWALLLLSAQSKVELIQEEFYQDLKIRALDAASEALIGSGNSANPSI